MFATIWYAGVVVMWMGGADLTPEMCMEIRYQIEDDIYQSYIDPNTSAQLTSHGLMYDKWKVTCEKRIPVEDI